MAIGEVSGGCRLPPTSSYDYRLAPPSALPAREAEVCSGGKGGCDNLPSPQLPTSVSSTAALPRSPMTEVEDASASLTHFNPSCLTSPNLAQRGDEAMTGKLLKSLLLWLKPGNEQLVPEESWGWGLPPEPVEGLPLLLMSLS